MRGIYALVCGCKPQFFLFAGGLRVLLRKSGQQAEGHPNEAGLAARAAAKVRPRSLPVRKLDLVQRRTQNAKNIAQNTSAEANEGALHLLPNKETWTQKHVVSSMDFLARPIFSSYLTQEKNVCMFLPLPIH